MCNVNVHLGDDKCIFCLTGELINKSGPIDYTHYVKRYELFLGLIKLVSKSLPFASI